MINAERIYAKILKMQDNLYYIFKARKRIKVMNKKLRGSVLRGLVIPGDTIVVIYYEVKMFIFTKLSKAINRFADWAYNIALKSGFKVQALHEDRKTK